jgi:hypothetical protein
MLLNTINLWSKPTLSSHVKYVSPLMLSLNYENQIGSFMQLHGAYSTKPVFVSLPHGDIIMR